MEIRLANSSQYKIYKTFPEEGIQTKPNLKISLFEVEVLAIKAVWKMTSPPFFNRKIKTEYMQLNNQVNFQQEFYLISNLWFPW